MDVPSCTKFLYSLKHRVLSQLSTTSISQILSEHPLLLSLRELRSTISNPISKRHLLKHKQIGNVPTVIRIPHEIMNGIFSLRIWTAILSDRTPIDLRPLCWRISHEITCGATAASKGMVKTKPVPCFVHSDVTEVPL